MRKLNNKNKFFILLFSFIIIGIVAIFIYSINMSGKFDKTTSIYPVSTNSVVYNGEYVLLDTKQGGDILKNWNNSYYFVDYEDNGFELGDKTVIYEKSSEKVSIFGENHFVSPTGNIVKNNDKTLVENTNQASFYKLDDRVYLIIANEIYTEDKTIYTSKYLIVTIDKQGNASFLNDVINVKTINPIKLTFNDYIFDIANEKLTVNKNTIDLKLINGSSNQYIPRENVVNTEDVDMKEFLDSYNKLVNDFSQYVTDTNLLISSNNNIVNNTIITNGTDSSSNNANTVKNNTNIIKRASLRGTISYPTYIDVTYLVTDPEESYQAVYLLVTGVKSGEMTTEKIILNKYETSYRITDLEPESEYTISLGYVQIVKNDGFKELFDYTADVINIRTTPADSKIIIDKISGGYAYCTFKLTEKYAVEGGKLVLYTDDVKTDELTVDSKQALSKNGYSVKLRLAEGSIYEIKLEDAKYNNKPVVLDIGVKFTYQSSNIY